MAIPSRRADPKSIAPIARTFFITSSIAGKRNLLQSARSARLFIEVLYHYRAQRKFQLHSFVVMPDHFHALVTLSAEISIERTVQFIKGGFAFRAGRELGFRAPVWQRGFSEVRIYDSDHCKRALDYIAENPVKRMLARTASEFPFSSFHPGFGVDDPPQGLKPHPVLLPTRHV